MKSVLLALFPVFDVIFSPFVALGALILKLTRRVGVQRLPLCKRILLFVGVFPIRNHYYEPLFDSHELKTPLSDERSLPGLDLNVQEQLHLLAEFRYGDELLGLTGKKTNELTFHFDNEAFRSGDAEYLYNLIRMKKPKRIYEIGSGNSTLMAIKATSKNAEETPGYNCDHLCVEPYEMPWLERSGVTVVRRRVQDLPVAFFGVLEKGDLLFIDSSHMIRPQGDVLYEYLQLLPTLAPGVLVHVHDIFTPRDYLESWVIDEVKFWNEQYLLEALLTGTKSWKVIGALNYLKNNYYAELKTSCPFLTPDREPGSFYIEKLV